VNNPMTTRVISGSSGILGPGFSYDAVELVN
jgi:hypothetical protein